MTTKITLTNIDSTGDYSELVDSAYNTANAASSYANSGFIQSNTATTNAATADQRAVTSGSYANSAYTQANTANTNAATAEQIAVTSGVYANAAYAKANTAATAYITPRVVVIADGTTVTMNADTTDIANQSNTQAVGTLTIASPTGTPSNGQKLIFRLLSTNIQTFSWNAVFQSGSNKYDYMGFIWNSTNSKWQILAKNMGY
jgi:hypothetical protein